ncbi:MAG: phage tail tape measure protein, partial [Candidatus Methanomethylophilaceae archaeon]
MAVTTNIDIVVRAFDQASQVLTGVQTKVQTLEMTAAKMQRAGVGMMVAGAAMLYPFMKAINVYSEFENELRNVVAISQEFADASVGVEKFGKVFVDVASQTKFAAAEVAEAGYAFVSRGFDFSDVESG